ncbi:hypothetical protein ACWD4L_23480 [Streptomyces sp. NPDC002596]|uniref:hypothetical protein n=1 Tax=Streptomyces sp. NPDC057580 TaxID=3346173 RepID=UPI00369B965A
MPEWRSAAAASGTLTARFLTSGGIAGDRAADSSGQGEECLTGRRDARGLLLEFGELRGQLRDLRADSFLFGGDLLFAGLKQDQDGTEGEVEVGHAPRQVGAAVPVSRRAITSLIAQ